MSLMEQVFDAESVIMMQDSTSIFLKRDNCYIPKKSGTMGHNYMRYRMSGNVYVYVPFLR